MHADVKTFLSETQIDMVPKILVLDLETTGLKVEDGDVILEVGMVAFNAGFWPVAEFQCLVNGDAERVRWGIVKWNADDGDEGARIVTEMHDKSGLAKSIEAGEGISVGEAQQSMIEWANDVGAAGLPITGSNAKFDRKFLDCYMPEFSEHTMHYRSLDVSSIKEFFRAYFPQDYAKARGALAPNSKHRSIDDCYDTRNELKEYYLLLARLGLA